MNNTVAAKSSNLSGCSIFMSRNFHIALLCVGAIFLSLNAFHNNVWFDESYSVAIANHSFDDIWYIGSGDVHPVLYYWGLHVLNIIFGQNLVVYRFATLFGVFVTACLGFTCLRKDFGAKIGVLFSFLVLTTPYVVVMATEIRMYSWVFFSVSVCALFSFRIAQAIKHNAPCPRWWWIVFSLSSLASAYLHYFGVLTAFLINAMFLVFLVRNSKNTKKFLVVFAFQTLFQVVLYLPWLSVLLGQVGVVSKSYWANISLESIFNVFTYLVATDGLCFAWRGEYGLAAEVLSVAFFGIFIALVVGYIVAVKAKKKTFFSCEPKSKTQRAAVMAGWLAFCLYGGVILLSLVASVVMDSFILYYRYAFVASGPLLFAISVLLSRMSIQVFTKLFCALALCVSVFSLVVLLGDNYSEENDDALVYFKDVSADAPLVLSSDIGVEGVMCVEYPEIKQTYLDWQAGNWAQSYLAYAPSLISVKSWDEALKNYTGVFVVLGQSSKGEEPCDVNDLMQKEGVSLIESRAFYRPYERTYFTVALLEKA